MSVSKEKKKELIKKYEKSSKDKGSTDVQVAILSHRISSLTEHLKTNKKDQSTRRGLLKMVGRRKKLLSWSNYAIYYAKMEIIRNWWNDRPAYRWNNY